MASLCNCQCGSYLEFFYQKIQDLWHEVDDIMTQNATSNVENSHVQPENNKEREMFAVAMHHLPLFEDDIEAKIPSTSSTTTYSNAFKSTKKSQEEYKQLNKSKTSSNQNTKDHLKDSAVQDAEDMMWEFIDLKEIQSNTFISATKF